MRQNVADTSRTHKFEQMQGNGMDPCSKTCLFHFHKSADDEESNDLDDDEFPS